PSVSGLVAERSGTSTAATLFTIGQKLVLEFRARDAETAVDASTVVVTFDDVFPATPATLVAGTTDLYRTAELTVPSSIGQTRTSILATAAARDFGGNTGVS